MLLATLPSPAQQVSAEFPYLQARPRRMQPPRYEASAFAGLDDFNGDGITNAENPASGASCDREDNGRGRRPQDQRGKFSQNLGNSRSTKQRASGIAVKAAQEAKKANDDMSSAVKIASQKIKLEYAEKAAAAAKAAEAVLAGKAQVLEQLELEVREAELVVQEESQALCTAESNSQLAGKAASQAKEGLKLILQGLKVARENFESSEQVSNGCKQSLADKTNLLEAAQKRVTLLLRQLTEARNDFTKTKQAAQRAACAANEAKERINRQRRRTYRKRWITEE
ncbi:uncharacterized protein LOC115620196 [Scaptodrosophila lebanonensis]|uniref:Uncharacterized protein LOC115620196 n=1 Tax=Drosophila lebanonensis TaxID=7225 RepID=A0A6J2SZ38_DROLE|nr:uncharacterized protein LOC115620196 [Scaptodrosophila lebanonensis]